MSSIHVLLIEDNEGDILLISEALEEKKMVSKISVVKDGKLAVEILARKGNNQETLLPDLILLDVNLPRKNGHEVLQYIKGSAYLRQIPVIMLSTSSSEGDILQSYRNYANCFITKPGDAGDFSEVVTGIERFWLSIVQLPKNY